MNHDDDSILEACLAEVLGGQLPPDLSQRILDEIARGTSRALSNEVQLDSGAAEPLLPPSCVSLQVAICSLAERKSNLTNPIRGRSRRDRSVLAGVGVVSSLGLVVLVSAVAFWLQRSRDRQDHLDSSRVTASSAQGSSAQDSEPSQIRLPAAPPSVSVSPSNRPDRAAPRPKRPRRAASEPAVAAGEPLAKPLADSLAESTGLSGGVPTGSLPTEGLPANGALPSKVEVQAAPGKFPSLLANAEIVDRVNSQLREYWGRKQGPVPNLLSGDAWVRRVFTVLLGRQPTNEENQKFTADSLASRTKLVSDLMNGDAYQEEFAKHWSEVLTSDFLPNDLVAAGPSAHREGMLKYFHRVLLDRSSFDQVATELLTATGSGQPDDSDYRGEANFLLARAGGKMELAASDSARLLLGHGIACQQCHDDPRDSGRRQQEFWEFNAFFRQLVARRNGNDQPTKLADADFSSESKQSSREAMVFYETPAGLMKSAVPTFPDRSDLPRSGLIAEVNWRQELARCVTSSRDFRLASVNRLWALAQGSGFATGGDLSTVEPALQGLLAELGDQFAAHRFDVRDVLTWIVLSDACATPAADPSSLVAQQLPRFQRFIGRSPVVRRTAAESLLAVARKFAKSVDSVATTAKIDSVPPGIGKNGKPVLVPPNVAASTFSGPPASSDPLIRKILMHPKLSTSQKADHLCQLALQRPARRREVELVERLVSQAGDQPLKAWDLIWAALHPTPAP